jgi:hypothetical protein
VRHVFERRKEDDRIEALTVEVRVDLGGIHVMQRRLVEAEQAQPCSRDRY